MGIFRKNIPSSVLLAVMLISLTGCGKKSSIHANEPEIVDTSTNTNTQTRPSSTKSSKGIMADLPGIDFGTVSGYAPISGYAGTNAYITDPIAIGMSFNSEFGSFVNVGGLFSSSGTTKAQFHSGMSLPHIALMSEMSVETVSNNTVAREAALIARHTANVYNSSTTYVDGSYLACMLLVDGANYRMDLIRVPQGQTLKATRAERNTSNQILATSVLPGGSGLVELFAYGSTTACAFRGSLVTLATDTEPIRAPSMPGARLINAAMRNYAMADLEKARNNGPLSVFNDDFNRTDSSFVGTSWSEVLGDVGIASGEIRNNAAGAFSLATFAGTGNTSVSLKDVDLKANLDANPGSVGLVARYNGPNDKNYYELNFSRSTSDGRFYLQFYKNVNGTRTLLSAGTANPVAPAGKGLVRFIVRGSSLSAYFNGTLINAVTDTAVTAAGNLGIRTGGGTANDFTVTAVDP